MNTVWRVWAFLVDVVAGVGAAGLLSALSLLAFRALDVGLPPAAISWMFASFAMVCVGGLALCRGGSFRRARTGPAARGQGVNPR